VGPERAATLAELRAVRESLDELNQVMTRQVEEKVAEVAVPRDEFTRRVRASGKRTVAGLLLVVLLAVGAVAVNRVTLLQAQRDFGEQVTRCFLRPGAVTTAEAAACDRQFSSDGEHEYLRLQERSVQANRRFADLQRWAKSKGWQPPP
jgi:hypothetical protein